MVCTKDCHDFHLNNGICTSCDNHDPSSINNELAPRPMQSPSGRVNFGTDFTSPAFCVLVGPTKKAYYPHENVLIAKIPYFKTLLTGSFQGTETAQSSVTLDFPADTEEAFEAVLEYAYLRSYDPITGSDANAKCLIHAQVYVLAERLCMNDLKFAALEKMIIILTKASSGPSSPQTPEKTKPRYAKRSKHKKESYYLSMTTGPQQSYDIEDEDEAGQATEAKISLNTLAKILKLVYANTPGDDELNYTNSKEDELIADNEPSTADKTTLKQDEKVDLMSQQPRTDKMRTLLSRYTASRMDEIKKCKELMALVKAYGDLAKDLILAAASGARVQSDEMKQL